MNTLNSLNILVVDDEDIVRSVLEMFLNHLGHNSHCVGDGRAGLRDLENGDFDAAIVDIRMPGLDGISFLSRSREIRPDMPVIIISGHADDETRAEVLAAGAFAFLSKPFGLNEISGLMKKICSSRGA